MRPTAHWGSTADCLERSHFAFAIHFNLKTMPTLLYGLRVSSCKYLLSSLNFVINRFFNVQIDQVDV